MVVQEVLALLHSTVQSRSPLCYSFVLCTNLSVLEQAHCLVRRLMCVREV